MNLKSPVLALSSGIKWCRQNCFSLVLSSAVHMVTSSSAASLSTLADNCLQELHPHNPLGSEPVGAARILLAGSAKSWELLWLDKRRSYVWWNVIGLALVYVSMGVKTPKTILAERA